MALQSFAKKWRTLNLKGQDQKPKAY